MKEVLIALMIILAIAGCNKDKSKPLKENKEANAKSEGVSMQDKEYISKLFQEENRDDIKVLKVIDGQFINNAKIQKALLLREFDKTDPSEYHTKHLYVGILGDGINVCGVIGWYGAERLDKLRAIKSLLNDKFSWIEAVYDEDPGWSGNSFQQLILIRWNGSKFHTIWTYQVHATNLGNRGGDKGEANTKVDYDYVSSKIIAETVGEWTDEQKRTRKDNYKEIFVWDAKLSQFVLENKKEKVKAKYHALWPMSAVVTREEQ